MVGLFCRLFGGAGKRSVGGRSAWRSRGGAISSGDRLSPRGRSIYEIGVLLACEEYAWPADPDEVPGWRLAAEDMAREIDFAIPAYRTRREYERDVLGIWRDPDPGPVIDEEPAAEIEPVAEEPQPKSDLICLDEQPGQVAIADREPQGVDTPVAEPVTEEAPTSAVPPVVAAGLDEESEQWLGDVCAATSKGKIMGVAEYAKLWRVSTATASRRIKHLVDNGLIVVAGTGRGKRVVSALAAPKCG